MLVSDPCRASADCRLTAVATSASPHAGPTTLRRSPTCPISVYRPRRSSPCSTKPISAVIVVDASAGVLGLLNDGDARWMVATDDVAVPHLADSEIVHSLRGQLL
jgi:hypothetical protein